MFSLRAKISRLSIQLQKQKLGELFGSIYWQICLLMGISCISNLQYLTYNIETTSHYLLHCPDYLEERKTLLNTISCIVPNIFDFNNDQLTEILLYGKDDLDNINSTSILDATINYLIETKRFNAQLF